MDGRTACVSVNLLYGSEDFISCVFQGRPSSWGPMKEVTVKSLLLIFLMFFPPLRLPAQATEKYRLLSAQGVKEFIEELNRSGESGFRLREVTATPNRSRPFEEIDLVGVVEREPRQSYEYEWFEAYTPQQLEREINARARLGFHFKKAIPFAENYCGIVSTTIVRPGATTTERADAILTDVLEKASVAEAISYGAIFLVERTSTGSELRRYRVAADTIASEDLKLKGTSEGLLDQHLEMSTRGGFRPVGMMPLRQHNRVSAVVLLESDFEAGEVHLKAVVARSRFEIKVNKLANVGHRLLFAGGNGLEKYALMVKDGGSPGAYTWVSVDSKKSVGLRPGLPFQGGDFQLVSYGLRECDFLTTDLVVRNRGVAAARGTETRLLVLHDAAKVTAHQTGKPLEISDESKRKLAELSNQGFIVSGIFYADDVNLIMERTGR